MHASERIRRAAHVSAVAGWVEGLRGLATHLEENPDTALSDTDHRILVYCRSAEDFAKQVALLGVEDVVFDGSWVQAVRWFGPIELHVYTNKDEAFYQDERIEWQWRRVPVDEPRLVGPLAHLRLAAKKEKA